jgi:hypothetical protein
LPFSVALFPHQASFLGPTHMSAIDKVADHGESEYRNLHFFIFGHKLPPFWDFRVLYPKKKIIKMTLFGGVSAKCTQRLIK